jgi:hypothetical protein
MDLADLGARYVMVREFRPVGYPVDHPLIPQGMAVALNAPAAFRFTAPACPEKHLEAAEALGADISGAGPEDAGEVLAGRIIEIMKRLKSPTGLGRWASAPIISPTWRRVPSLNTGSSSSPLDLWRRRAWPRYSRTL